MEKLKSIFAKAVTETSIEKLWKARYELCSLYNPEDTDLCMHLDRAVKYIDFRIAELTN